MIQISLKQARSYIVESQLLNRGPKSGRSKRALQVIEHLGYVQIDTISVVARSHNHIFWSRVPNYQRNILEKLESEKRVFEYWAHAASYLPMKDFRFTLVPKQKIKQGPGHWRPRDPKWIEYVYDRFKHEGPLMSKDFEKDPKLKHDHAWGGHPVTQAMRQLFMEGDLMISGRKGFQKIYDLTEKVIPNSVDTTVPSQKEYYKYLVIRDLKAQGILRAVEIGHLISIPVQHLKNILAELLEDGVVRKLKINKLEDQVFYTLATQFDEHFAKKRRRRLHILSPFDNFVIQRKRLKYLFDFDYLLECYVPKDKRRVGYYSLPILWGSNFIGQVDLKADRKNRILVIRNLVWQAGLRQPGEIEHNFKNILVDYCSFNACDKIEISDIVMKKEHPISLNFNN